MSDWKARAIREWEQDRRLARARGDKEEVADLTAKINALREKEIRKRYPETPALGKTDTSREAAAIMRPCASTLRDLVLKTLKERGPMSSYQASEITGVDHSALQPRFSELKALGQIIDTGERHRRPNGRSASILGLPKPKPVQPNHQPALL